MFDATSQADADLKRHSRLVAAQNRALFEPVFNSCFSIGAINTVFETTCAVTSAQASVHARDCALRAARAKMDACVNELLRTRSICMAYVRAYAVA